MSNRNELGQFAGQGIGIPYKQSPLSVKLPREYDAIVRALPNRSEWLRRVIMEAVDRELMPKNEP